MSYLHIRSYTLFLVLMLPVIVFGQFTELQKAENFADSVYQSLSVEERVGQLIFIRANQSGEPYIEEVGDLIKQYNLGGVVFFAGDPVLQALQTNKWNALPKTPLFISIDAEWGLGMRLKNTINYPLQMTLGAINDDELIYEMGKQIGEQCRRMGIHINFAPVVDVNNNPLNPVIGMRSFGENPTRVGEKAYQYMKGMQEEGVIACAKHFPGHGDTKTDSHVSLPVLNKTKKELRTTELLPFEYLISKRVNSIMIAHLSIPAFDKKKKLPATLSSELVTNQLKKKMGFNGLIITDGLDMKGITNYFNPDKIALKAFEAGNDILLIPEDIPASVKAITEAIVKGKTENGRLEESCKKILKQKYLTGAYNREPIDTTHLLKDLNQEKYHQTTKELLSRAVTIVRNDEDIVPVSYPDTLNPVVLIIGTEDETEFESILTDFFKAKVYRIKHDADISQHQKILTNIEDNDLVIIGVVNTNISASRKYGITESDIQFIELIARKKHVILDVFASPYSLDLFSSLSIFKSILVSFQDKPYLHKISAEIILGMHPATGKLPVSAGGFMVNTGIDLEKLRLSYESPEELAISSYYLDKIDSIALNGIEIKAFPGCQIIGIKNGYIFYDKSFGYHTYDSVQPVLRDDLYDLASLTKILATTPALMKLVDEQKIDIHGKLSDYLLYLKGTNKEEIGFREVLTHQAGLFPWLPYYENTLFDNDWDTAVYRSIISEEFPVRVAKNMYISENYQHNIYEQIIDSPIGEKEYAYSDLGFYFLKELIEQLTNAPFELYVDNEFYQPLGLKYMTYLPLRKIPISKIIPTENDMLFRHQLLIGDVHDQGAAMLGGVSGHAGLFGNAYDVAVIMQMFLNGGNYGGRAYISDETLEFFTDVQFPENDNRRGLGFDKPMLEFEEHLGNCKSASPSSFGHSGFTGTYTWADPETGLIYVFLSNRIYPEMNNSKIMDLDIRTNIHQLFYDAINSKNLTIAD